METLSAEQIAAGRRLRCPRCGSSVTKEPAFGRAGVETVSLTCTDLDCSWTQVAEVGPDVRARIADVQERAMSQKTNNTECRHPGCTKSTQARGLCSTHYKSWYQAGKPDVDEWLKGRAPARPSPESEPASAAEAVQEAAAEPDGASSAAPAESESEDRAALNKLDAGFLETVPLPEGATSVAFGFLGAYLTITTDAGYVLKQIPMPEWTRP